MIQNRPSESPILFSDFPPSLLAPRLRRRVPVLRRMAGPLPCRCLWRASSPVNELSVSFFHFLFLVQSRFMTRPTTLWTTLDDVPPLHLHALFGYCFALCRCGASAGTRCALGTRHLGMHRWEKPSTFSYLNDLGDWNLIRNVNGVSCIEQRRAC